ncbi:hypothetical protein FB451DRAFT_665518 [Mycena latifolia]|nr:hypothetical protein FB451DRAFT_665518 [Mycena latifolia]
MLSARIYAPRTAPFPDSVPATTSFASLVFPTDPGAAEAQASTKADLAKSVIEWLFVVIAVILIICLFLRKLLGAPRALQYPSTSNDLGTASGYTYAYPGIAALHLTHPRPARPARARTRPTRAADIDADGRRAQGDVELDLSEAEMLPAYDGLDRPPKYMYAEVAAATEEPVGGLQGASLPVLGADLAISTTPRADTGEP